MVQRTTGGEEMAGVNDPNSKGNGLYEDLNGTISSIGGHKLEE